MISPKSTLSCKEADRRAGEGHTAPVKPQGRSGAQEKLSEAVRPDGLASVPGVTGCKRQ